MTTTPPLDAAREHEIRTLDLTPLMDDRSAAVISGHLAVLLAEVDRLRAERDEFCNRVDTLTSVAKGNKRHVQELFLDLQKTQAALTEIRHLHKDSPMGPCPVCIDADAAASGGDGLVPYPCPTGRLAGSQDCDPPARPAAVAAVAETGE
ncbi:hypothetical protein OIE52_39000 [Streptomyces canus]|uniref:hypothetical protein n=1 Tax=Streptomyces canus TaxID=58343 RepID=UPI003246DDEA